MQAILADFPDSGLALARSLHRRGVPVTMLGGKRWAARTRSADERYLLGQPHRQPDAWLTRLEALARRGPGVLISGSDVATEFFVRERGRIPAGLRSFESPQSAHLKLMNKRLTYELAERAGVRFPWTLNLTARGDLERVAEEASYPCLLKPALSHLWRGLFGERRVILVRNPDELARKAGVALDSGLELLVNEHVPGPDENLEAAVLIRLEDGSYPLRYGRRKVRMYPPGYGAGSIHESADVPETMELTIRLLDTLEFVGVCNGETKRHEETEERVLMEINGRVPRGWGLADAAGTDGSWRLYAALARLPLDSQQTPRIGVRTIVPALELRAVVAHLSERRLTPRQILAGYRGVRDVSGLSWRDPLPILLVLVDFARWLGRGLKARLPLLRS